MISFDLRCGKGHIFEAWFGSGRDYEDQKARNLVSCPICDDQTVEKAVMAPAVAAKGNSSAAVQADQERLQRLMLWQRSVEANARYVGQNFATEARALHALPEEERPDTPLIGQTSAEEVAELLEEGVPIAPLPFRLLRDAEA